MWLSSRPTGARVPKFTAAANKIGEVRRGFQFAVRHIRYTRHCAGLMNGHKPPARTRAPETVVSGQTAVGLLDCVLLQPMSVFEHALDEHGLHLSARGRGCLFVYVPPPHIEVRSIDSIVSNISVNF